MEKMVGKVPGTNNDEEIQDPEDQNAQPIKGACMTMCPNDEMRLRQRENLIHPLESKVNEKGQRLGYADPRRMVKEFSRSAAGHQIKAADVRCLPVLQRTVNYLLSVVCSYKDVSWREIYDFVNDRLRSVRQDITVQGLRSKEVIKILAPAARFYIYAHYRLCEYEVTEFDPYLNLQQLNEIVLTIISILKGNSYESEMNVIDYEFKLSKNQTNADESLDSNDSSNEESLSEVISLVDNCHINSNCGNEEMSATLPPIERVGCQTSYTNIRCNSASNISEENSDVDARAQPSKEEAQKESALLYKYSVVEEMVALYALINIGRSEVLANILDMPKSVRSSPLVSRVTDASVSWMKSNHLPLIRLSSVLTPVLASALHLHLNKVQRQALGVLSVAHNSKVLNYSSEDLISNLLFSSFESLQKACQYYGLSSSSQGIQFVKANFKWDVPVLKSVKAEWLETKLRDFTISELLLGY